MTATMGREKYFLLGMTALSLLLASVLLWEWQRGLELRGELLQLRKMPVTAIPPQKILPEFSLPDPETGFPELLARPVFSVGRRPFTTTAQADAGAMKKGQFVLVGILISPGHRSALLRDVTTGKTETVAQVGVIRGMTVGQVLPGRVVLRQGEESEELLLNVQTGPKPPQRSQAAPPPSVISPALAASAPKPPASSAVPGTTPVVPAKPGAPASAPRPPTAQELIQAEKQQQAALEQIKRQMPAVPPTPPSAAPR